MHKVFQEGDMPMFFFSTEEEFSCWHIHAFIKRKKKNQIRILWRILSKAEEIWPLHNCEEPIQKKKEIVKKIHNDVHVVDLPGGMSISKIFNIVDSKTSCSQWRGLM